MVVMMGISLIMMMLVPFHSFDTIRTVHDKHFGIIFCQSLAPCPLKAEVAHHKIYLALAHVDHHRGSGLVCFRTCPNRYERVNRKSIPHDPIKKITLGLDGYR